MDKTLAVFSLNFILLWMGEPEKERNEKRSHTCIKIRDGKDLGHLVNTFLPPDDCSWTEISAWSCGWEYINL